MIRASDAPTREKEQGAAPREESGALDRSFKYAVIVYAVVEFFAIALVLYYKLAR